MFDFMSYISRRNQQVIEHLKLVKEILGKGGLEVRDNTSENADPYLFVFNPQSNLSFDGIRIYNIGNKLAFRAQKHEDTEPFGKAYGLNVEKLFEDMMTDDTEDKKMAVDIAKAIIAEVKMFFKESWKAENDPELAKKDPLDRILVRTAGHDYSNVTYNSGKY